MIPAAEPAPMEARRLCDRLRHAAGAILPRLWTGPPATRGARWITARRPAALRSREAGARCTGARSDLVDLGAGCVAAWLAGRCVSARRRSARVRGDFDAGAWSA